MLRPVEMQKVNMAVPKSLLNNILKKIHSLGLIEIRRFKQEFPAGKTVELYDGVASQVVRLRRLKRLLRIKTRKSVELELNEALKRSEKLSFDSTLESYHHELRRYKKEQASLEYRLRRTLEILFLGDVDLSQMQTEKLEFHVGKIPKQKLTQLRKYLQENHPENYELKFHALKDETVIALLSKKEAFDGSFALSRFGFTEINTEGFTTPQKTAKQIRAKISERKEKIKKINEKLFHIADDYREELLVLEGALSLWADRLNLTKEFGMSERTAFITGWVVSSKYEKFKTALEKEFEGSIFIQKAEADEESPVVLDNPEVASQFQFLVELFSLPKPGEIDPTIILFFTIPIIYGMMFGDVFYGIISFIFATFLYTKFKKGMMHEIARIWALSGIAGIIFGIAFDEWLGTSHFAFLNLFANLGWLSPVAGPLYDGFSRSHGLPLLIVASIFIGLIHLALGFLLGAINEWHHNRKHAYAKLSWIFFELGAFLTIATYMYNLFPEAVGFAGAIILGVSFILIAVFEGLIGIVEIPSLLGNVLSYARIAAVGLAGVMIAEVINEALFPTGAGGILGVLLVLPLLLFLHFLNILLAMVECIIQGGRLNLVEFYSKFFQGGGRVFVPFKIEK
ncbi:hypothetical protein KAW38_01155 [Candidatus Micrarchaeota archaeon]|nr:hypothetical protein [Candidatus Micrarchaeota archaeon]